MNLTALEPKVVTTTVENFQMEITGEQKYVLAQGLFSYIQYCQDEIKEEGAGLLTNLFFHAREIETSKEMLKVLDPDLLKSIEEE